MNGYDCAHVFAGAVGAIAAQRLNAVARNWWLTRKGRRFVYQGNNGAKIVAECSSTEEAENLARQFKEAKIESDDTQQLIAEMSAWIKGVRSVGDGWADGDDLVRRAEAKR